MKTTPKPKATKKSSGELWGPLCAGAWDGLGDGEGMVVVVDGDGVIVSMMDEMTLEVVDAIEDDMLIDAMKMRQTTEKRWLQ